MFLTVDFYFYLMDNPMFTMILEFMFAVLDDFIVSPIANFETYEIDAVYVGCAQVELTICGEPVPQSLIDFRL